MEFDSILALSAWLRIPRCAKLLYFTLSNVFVLYSSIVGGDLDLVYGLIPTSCENTDKGNSVILCGL